MAKLDLDIDSSLTGLILDRYSFLHNHGMFESEDEGSSTDHDYR